MNASDLVLVTSGYRVIALKKSNGSPVWGTTLIDKFFKPGQPFVTMIVDETGVYVHTIGEIFRLDLQTGAIVWKRDLNESGWNRNQIASLAMLGASGSPAGPASQKIGEQRRSD